MDIANMETLKINTGQGFEVDLKIAGLGARSYGFLIDFHIKILLIALWLPVAIFLLGSDTNDLTNSQSRGFWLIAVPSIFIFMFYQLIVELLMSGSSPGKRSAKVRIVASNGMTPSVSAILIRNLFRLIDSMPVSYLFGMVCCLLTKQQVRIGDIAAGTLLVYSEEKPKNVMNQISKIVDHKQFSAQELATGEALLSRWKDLNPDTRSQLGRKLLTKLEPSVNSASYTSDKQIQQQLKQLLKS